MQRTTPNYAAHFISSLSKWFVDKRSGTEKGLKVLPLFGTRSHAAVNDAASSRSNSCQTEDMLHLAKQAVKATTAVCLLPRIYSFATKN